MSSPICISDDDDSFDPPEEIPSRVNSIQLSDDEEVETHNAEDLKTKRQALIKNLFPVLKKCGNRSSSSKSKVINPPGVSQSEFVEKKIGGVSVTLPVNPYGCQLAVMFKVITAIDKKKNCLLESPTGTGKTLALLCSALAWQKKEQDRISQEEATLLYAQHPELTQLQGAVEYIASPNKSTVESPEIFFSKRVYGQRSIYDTPEEQTTTECADAVNKRLEPLNDSSDGSPNDGLVTLQKKMRYNSKSPQNSTELPSTPEKCIVTEETGTPQKVRNLYKLVDNLRVRTAMSVDSSVPTIYYGARTHKQIQQVVKEFARTSYCGEALMSILSSRDHSCIREFDRSQWPSKNDMCRSCVKTINITDKPKDPKQKTNCKYYDNRTVLNRRVLPPAFDLDDLVSAGTRASACPYYGAREMAKTANIVFCPYNYLIEPGIRKSMKIDLTDNIVIIDEGHNIEDICRDAATFNFTRDQMQNAIKELEIVSAFRYANHKNTMKCIEHLVTVLKNWDQWFENQTPLINNQSVNGMEAVFTWQVEHFIQTLNYHNIGQSQYKEFHESAETFCSKLREDPRTLIGVTQSTGTLLESLDTVFGFLYRHSGIYMDDFKPVLVRKIRSKVSGANAWRTSHFNKTAENEPLTLRLICMNPAVVFEGLHPARCIILASGTLTPQISMQSELATEFPLKISPKHIIPRDRVWIGTLWSCPDGSPLECTSRGTKLLAVQDALGQAVRRVCEVTPHGILCFFPSYYLMNTLVKRWQDTDLWKNLEQIKYVFMESSDTKDHDTNMEDYYECVGTDKGALLFAVYRGKVAEGMDFKDQQARAVITVGVPYPSKYDIGVVEKMNYNNKYTNKRNLLPGDKWYLVQAYRALNQALGRCVRHRGDWGAVLLLDARFRDPHYTQHLSAWVKDFLGSNHHTFGSLVNGSNSLKAFMETMTRSEEEGSV